MPEVLHFLSPEEIIQSQQEFKLGATYLPENFTSLDMSHLLKGHEEDTLHIYKEDDKRVLHNGTLVRINPVPDGDSVEQAYNRYLAAEEVIQLNPAGIVFSRDRSRVPESLLSNGD